MSHLVILEGPDGSGKTTLARRLQKNYGYGYIHTGPPKFDENVLLTYALTLYHAHHSKKNYVIDRLHLGERIYGPILRNVDRLGSEGATILERMINAYGAKVVICLPPYEIATVNWLSSQKSEYVKDLEQYRVIYQMYENLSKASNCFTWNYTNDELDPFVNSVLQLSFNKCPDPVIGSPNCKYLIIGEKANQKELDVPWVSLVGSSHYLYSCLHEASFQESEMAFVNALRLDGGLNPVIELWEKLKSPVPIMLGRIAHHSMNGCHHSGYVLHHPAYWQRFHHNERNLYVTQLRKIRSNPR